MLALWRSLKPGGPASVWEVSGTPADVLSLPIPPDNVHRHSCCPGSPRWDHSDAEYWFGAPSGEVARERLHAGWDDGARDALSAVSLLSLPRLPLRTRSRWDVVGDDLDADRVLRRTPEPFLLSDRVPVPIVWVSVDVCANCGTPASELRWRGVAALAAVDGLTRAGFSVGLEGLSFVRGLWPDAQDKHAAVRLLLKRPGEVLRPGLMAGAVCTTAAFRMACFHAYYASPHRVNSGLGYSCSVPDALRRSVHVSDDVRSRDDAQEWLSSLPVKLRGVRGLRLLSPR